MGLWLSGTDDPCKIRRDRLETGGAFLQSADLNQTPSQRVRTERSPRTAGSPKQQKMIPSQISFEDVAVAFTLDEWHLLSPTQKSLYRDVMLETYSNFVFLGCEITKPDAVFKLEPEEPWVITEEVLSQNLSDLPSGDTQGRFWEAGRGHKVELSICRRSAGGQDEFRK